jgi:hypothetical protein
VLALRSEVEKVALIDVVLNLQVAVYCTLILHTLYLMTFFSRCNSELLFISRWYNTGFGYFDPFGYCSVAIGKW